MFCVDVFVNSTAQAITESSAICKAQLYYKLTEMDKYHTYHTLSHLLVPVPPFTNMDINFNPSMDK